MKKLLIAGMLLLSVAAIHASNNNAKQRSDADNYSRSTWNFNDTVPTDTTSKDTTSKDTTSKDTTRLQ